jgi:hypothetical protein
MTVHRDRSFKRARQAAAAFGILERAGGQWVTAVELIRAGVQFPAQAIALLQSTGKSIEVRQVPGQINRYRLPVEQLSLDDVDVATGAAAPRRDERRSPAS